MCSYGLVRHFRILIADKQRLTLNKIRLTLEEDLDIVINGQFPSFTGDCLPAAPLVFSTTGTIGAGESQTCNIVNNFVINIE
jgi:hypothetical protein